MQWKALNWRRGGFRVWLTLSVAWVLAWSIVFASNWPLGRLPSNYRDYLPVCYLGEGPINLRAPTFDASRSPLITGMRDWDPYETSEERRARIVDGEARVRQCESERVAREAEAHAERLAAHRDCLAGYEHPAAIERAQGRMHTAQLEWVGSVLAIITFVGGLPVVAWLGVLLLARVMRWIVSGFGPT